MQNKFTLSLLLLLLSIPSLADTVLPEDVFNEIKVSGNITSGDILYVDFWASWCNPCRKSFPWMNKMVEKYHAQGFRILAINVDKDRALADKFLASVDTAFPVFYDPEGSLAKQFQLKGMPSSFILNSEGVILKVHKGFFEDQLATYEQEIQSLLKNSH